MGAADDPDLAALQLFLGHQAHGLGSAADAQGGHAGVAPQAEALFNALARAAERDLVH